MLLKPEPLRRASAATARRDVFMNFNSPTIGCNLLFPPARLRQIKE